MPICCCGNPNAAIQHISNSSFPFKSFDCVQQIYQWVNSFSCSKISENIPEELRIFTPVLNKSNPIESNRIDSLRSFSRFSQNPIHKMAITVLFRLIRKKRNVWFSTGKKHTMTDKHTYCAVCTVQCAVCTVCAIVYSLNVKLWRVNRLSWRSFLWFNPITTEYIYIHKWHWCD